MFVGNIPGTGDLSLAGVGICGPIVTMVGAFAFLVGVGGAPLIHGATGENAVVVGTRKADIIAGPIGIVIADSLYGEITPKMALAVAQSNAKRILIPFNHCDNIIAGVADLSVGKLIQSAVEEIRKILA